MRDIEQEKKHLRGLIAFTEEMIDDFTQRLDDLTKIAEETDRDIANTKGVIIADKKRLKDLKTRLAVLEGKPTAYKYKHLEVV